MNILSKPLALSLIAAMAVSAPALAEDKSEGRRLAELAFQSLDTKERGYIDLGEFMGFGDDVFVSMDNNEDGKISLGEFLDWDYGMRPVAVEAGREDAYETALRVVFAFWDRDGDGVISKTDHRQALQSDFRRADANNDALLDEKEFTGGFSVMVALRAAINPAPAE